MNPRLPAKPRITRLQVIEARIQAHRNSILAKRGIVDPKAVAALHCAADEIHRAFLTELERVRHDSRTDPLEAHCEHSPDDPECRIHDL